MSRIAAHVHKLKRFRYKSTGHSVFHCVLDCSFKVDVPLALGKKVECWRCGREFSINEYSLRLAKPHCTSCTKIKTEDIIDKVNTDNNSVAIVNKEETVNDLRDRLTKTMSNFAATADSEAYYVAKSK